MALIKCPECGAEISDKAKACPKCGNPIKIEGAPSQKVGEECQATSIPVKKKKSFLKVAILMWPLLILEIILVIVPLVVSSLAGFTVPDKLPEYTAVSAVAFNIIFAIWVSIKIWKELRVTAKERQNFKKNAVALVLSVCFFFFNCSYMYGAIFPKKADIVGTWQSDFLDGYSTRYSFEKNGNFSSYVIENESGLKIPGGTGTYTVDGNEVVITMSSGSVINDEYKIVGDELEMNGFKWERID